MHKINYKIINAFLVFIVIALFGVICFLKFYKPDYVVESVRFEPTKFAIGEEFFAFPIIKNVGWKKTTGEISVQTFLDGKFVSDGLILKPGDAKQELKRGENVSDGSAGMKVNSSGKHILKIVVNDPSTETPADEYTTSNNVLEVEFEATGEALTGECIINQDGCAGYRCKINGEFSRACYSLQECAKECVYSPANITPPSSQENSQDNRDYEIY